MLEDEYFDFLGSDPCRGISTLSREQESSLWQRWVETQDQNARSQILVSHKPLCFKLSTEYARQSVVPVHDLFGVALLEMTRGFPLYDPANSHKARFATFIEQRLRGKILDYVISNTAPVKLATTKPQRALFANWRRLNEDVRRQYPQLSNHARYVAVAHLAEARHHQKITPEEVRDFEMRLKSRWSLNQPLLDDLEDSFEFLDTIPDPHDHIKDHFEILQTERDVSTMMRVFNHLTSREQHILRARFLDPDKLALHELGHQYGITAERVRQIEVSALKKMRILMSAQPS